MFRFVQPSSLKNDLVYQLTLSQLQHQLIAVIERLFTIGYIPDHTMQTVREVAQDEVAWQAVNHPGLQYVNTQFTGLGNSGATNEELWQLGRDALRYFVIPALQYEKPLTAKFRLSQRGNLVLPGLRESIEFGSVHKLRDVEVSVFPPGTLSVSLYDGTAFKLTLAHASYKEGGMYISSCDGLSVVSRSIHNRVGIELNALDPAIEQFFKDNHQVLMINGEESDSFDWVFQPIDNEKLFYETCLTLVNTIWPEMYTEIMNHIRVIGIVNTRGFGGFTTNYMEGAVFLSHRAYDYLWVTENLIHECGHSRLYQLFRIDDLVVNGPEARFDSPWRADKRPMEGILHGAYVFCRVGEWLRKFYAYAPQKVIYDRYREVVDSLERAVQVMRDSGEFTSLGQALFEEIEDETRRLGADVASFRPVSSESFYL